ncbi:MAG TPA: multidrug efflux SMR transporter [Rubneribacter badeniensis]|uniref:Multidrug efflux SMR transporter n=1 Tax=Rubneribacter badeniensis TaxID=2070688 RepID=A0A9D3AE05_9ACTN|nr:multidrug efflux SMR transporter [Rubneribacter badeniensis]
MGNLKDLLERANPFLLLSISIAAELCGTTSMKVSHGFSDPLFTALTICAYALAFSLFTIVLKKVPLGLAYGIWGGVGTVGTAAIGIVAWGDPFGWVTACGIALVVGGIALLNKGTQEIEEARAEN